MKKSKNKNPKIYHPSKKFIEQIESRIIAQENQTSLSAFDLIRQNELQKTVNNEIIFRIKVNDPKGMPT